MPQIDMPLAELEAYAGRNPKPDDFDDYWGQAVAEMHALGTECELVPNATLSAPFAEAFDLYFTGVGGARIHAKIARAQYRELWALLHQRVP